MRLIYAAGCLALFLTCETASALRCGNKLVSEGDHQVKVQRQCGDPVSVQVRSILRAGYPTARNRHVTGVRQVSGTRDELLIHDRSLVEVFVEEWIYNFGPRRLMRSVVFEDGIVTDVRILGYGFID